MGVSGEFTDQLARFQRILRSLAIIDVLLAIAPVIGLSRVVQAAPVVADALGYDVEAALDDPDGP